MIRELSRPINNNLSRSLGDKIRLGPETVPDDTLYWTDINDDNILDINGDPIEVIQP